MVYTPHTAALGCTGPQRPAGEGESGVGACPGRGLARSGRPRAARGRRRAELLPELPSSPGGAHFRVGPCGVRRSRRGSGGPEVSRGGRLPGPARGEERGAVWAAGPGGGGAPGGKAPGRAENTGLQARASGRRGETPGGFSGVPAFPLSSRVLGGVRVL